MDKYVLALLVTFEQEYAIQKLFGHSGWEYIKIGDEISVKRINTILSEESRHIPAANSEVLDTVTGKTSDFTEDNIAIKSVMQENITNRLENIANVEYSVAEDNVEEDADFDGVSDTEIVLNDHDIVQNEVGNNDIETGKNTVKSKNSDIGKDLAQTELKCVVKKRKDRAALRIGDNADTCVSEVNEEEMSVKNQQRNNSYFALETTKTVKHMSENVVAEDPDTEVCLDVPDDVDELGYSASFTAYICKNCSYAFLEESNYKLHRRDGLCVFPCQFCDVKYTFRNFTKYQTHLKEHRMMERNEKQTGQRAGLFVCPMCTKSFSSVYNMIRHVENIHTLQKDTQHKCHLCSFTCQTMERLSDHKKTHQSICADCGKIYSSKSSLNIHTKKMHSNKTFPCMNDNCSFIGTSQQGLDFHLNSHAGVKPYKCKHCGKSYPRKDSCSRHQLLCRIGVPCNVCGTNFKSKGTLSDHVRAVHSEERFTCICGSAFKYRANLHRHQKKLGHFISGNEYPEKAEYIAESLL